MTALNFAARLIRVFEGCRLIAYQDSGGIWTIGFGHTKGVQKGQIADLAQATTWLREDIKPLVDLVVARKPLEAAALLSFGYNCGAGALKRVLSGESRLEDFVRDRKGNVLAGLVARRALEAALIELGGET